MKKESEGLHAVHEQEKTSVEELLKNTEKRLKDAEAQNDVLHQQLQTLGDLAEKEQAARVDAAAGEPGAETATEGESAEIKTLNKSISELREVIRYLRSEKEMIQAQVDAAKRGAEREKASASVYKRSLDEARAELEVLTNSALSTSEGPDVKDLTEKLKSSEDQLKLLTDSNQLLRDEADKLKKSITSLQVELDASKQSVAPAEQRLRQLEADKKTHESEKKSLTEEVESWKDRVKKLVSKFNQVSLRVHEGHSLSF